MQVPICQEYWETECKSTCAAQDKLIEQISFACVHAFLKEYIARPEDLGFFELADINFLDVDVIEDAGFMMSNLTDLVESGSCSLSASVSYSSLKDPLSHSRQFLCFLRHFRLRLCPSFCIFAPVSNHASARNNPLCVSPLPRRHCFLNLWARHSTRS